MSKNRKQKQNKDDIWLQFEKSKKKMPDGAVIQKYKKQICIKIRIPPLFMYPQGPQGCQKHHYPLNTEVPFATFISGGFITAI